MNRRSKQEISELLSLYLDGELTGEESKEIEEIVASNPDVARELHELRSLKRLLAGTKRVPERLGFWTRLSTELDRREKEEENLLPFPRKYVPALSVAGVVAVVAIGLFLFQQRGDVVDYVSKQSERVQKAVEENVLKGSILPLFSSVDKNQVLQFALFGTLPLDAKAETALRIDESAEQGYRIDVGRKAKKTPPRVTIKDLYQEIQPTRSQALLIDSLLDLGRVQIEKSIYIADDKAMAIDPRLPGLNRTMLASITATLEPPQRVRFEKFLRVRNAPYMVAATTELPETADKILGEIHRAPKRERFIVVTPETLVFSNVPVDFHEMHRTVEQVGRQRHELQMKVDVLIRKFADRQEIAQSRVRIEQEPVRVMGDPDFISIHIGRDTEEVSAVPRVTWVRPRIPVPTPFGSAPRTRSFNVRYFNDDSMMMYDLQLDSVMVRMMKRAPGVPIDPEAVEALIEGHRTRMGIPPDQAKIDSIMNLFRDGQMSFESLMREIRKDDLRDRERVRKKRVARDFQD